MFQDFALFPHRNVYDNVAFGLRMAQHGKSVDPATGDRDARIGGTGRLRGAASHELSGGQQQRVALAAQSGAESALLLFDEPLGSLDRTLREDLMGELRRILKTVTISSGGASRTAVTSQDASVGLPVEARASITSIYVTHDQQEAFAIADRVIILNNGRIEQVGPPLALYRQPANRFVARFLGMQNLLAGRLLSDPLRIGGADCDFAGYLAWPQACAWLGGGRSGHRSVEARRGQPDLVNSGAGQVENVLHGQLRSLSFAEARSRSKSFTASIPGSCSSCPVPRRTHCRRLASR